MKKTRFTEAQIIGILNEQEQGMKVSDLCRKHGISDAKFYSLSKFPATFRLAHKNRKVNSIYIQEMIKIYKHQFPPTERITCSLIL